MKHIDDQIKEVFSEKFSGMEADVPAHLWDAVQSGISTGSAGSGAAVTAKVVGLKTVVAASAIVITAATALYYFTSSSEKPVEKIAPASHEIVEPANDTPTIPQTQHVETNVQASENHAAIESEREHKQKPGSTIVFDNNSSQAYPEQSSHFVGSPETNSGNQQLTGDSSEPKTSEQIADPQVAVTGNASEKTKENASVITGNFKILPADLNEMRYSFISDDKDARYEWNFGDESHSDLASPIHQYEEEGTFQVTLTVTDKSGKRRSSTHELSVYKPGEVLIQNVFTPNGDGSNDIFDPRLTSKGVTFNKVVIRDSQGKVVFESNGQNPWEGNDMSGSPCLAGSYQYYVSGLDRNQGILENKGIVVLIR